MNFHEILFKNFINVSALQPAEEPAPPKAQKEPSKFMFWKKKPKKEEKPVIPATPGTQNSSKACVIL